MTQHVSPQVTSSMLCDSHDFRLDGGQYNSTGRDMHHSVVVQIYNNQNPEENDVQSSHVSRALHGLNRNIDGGGASASSTIVIPSQPTLNVTGQPSQIYNVVTSGPCHLVAVDIEVVDIVRAELEEINTLPCISSPIFPVRPKQSDIYLRLMLQHGHGYPLYHPEPDRALPLDYRQNGVLIGDVGRITRHGSFDFLFNINPAHSGTVNPGVLPEDFEILPPFDLVQLNHFQPADDLLSEHVNQTGVSPITYQCSDRQGAVLQLPHGATSIEAKSLRPFYEIAVRHAESWYKYVLVDKGINVPNGALYLITGCIKTTNWGIGVFYGPPAIGNHLQFICNDSGTFQSYRWQKVGPILAKTRPLGNISGEEPNQCIFLSGYKITISQDTWDQLAKTSVLVPRSQGERSERRTTNYTMRGSAFAGQQNSSNQNFSGTQGWYGMQHAGEERAGIQESIYGHDGNSVSSPDQYVGDRSEKITLNELFSASPPVHPSDYISKLLLRQNPHSKVVLTHDNDWRDLLPGNFAVDHSQTKISELLLNVARSRLIVVDENGCVSLTKVPGEYPASVLTSDVTETQWPCDFQENRLEYPRHTPSIDTIHTFSLPHGNAIDHSRNTLSRFLPFPNLPNSSITFDPLASPPYNGSYNNSPYSAPSELSYEGESNLSFDDVCAFDDESAFTIRDYDPADYDAPHQSPLLMFNDTDVENSFYDAEFSTLSAARTKSGPDLFLDSRNWGTSTTSISPNQFTNDFAIENGMGFRSGTVTIQEGESKVQSYTSPPSTGQSIHGFNFSPTTSTNNNAMRDDSFAMGFSTIADYQPHATKFGFCDSNVPSITPQRDKTLFPGHFTPNYTPSPSQGPIRFSHSRTRSNHDFVWSEDGVGIAGGSGLRSNRVSPYPSPKASPRPTYGDLPSQVFDDAVGMGVRRGRVGSWVGGVSGVAAGYQHLPVQYQQSQGHSNGSMYGMESHTQGAMLPPGSGLAFGGPTSSGHIGFPGNLVRMSQQVRAKKSHVTMAMERVKKASVKRRKADATFTCLVSGCGSTFTRRFHLRAHMRSHNEEKTFTCRWPGCTESFATQHDCKRHEDLHTNYRPFMCGGCGKQYSRMDSLNRHLRSKCGTDSAKDQKLASLSSSPVVEDRATLDGGLPRDASDGHGEHMEADLPDDVPGLLEPVNASDGLAKSSDAEETKSGIVSGEIGRWIIC